jgi:hypothetical protein
MIFGKPKHSWYWHAFWSLASCFFFYRVSRAFLKPLQKAARREEKALAQRRTKKIKTWEDLFV